MARIKFYNKETGRWEYADMAVNAGQGGLTQAQISALDDMFKIAAYTADAKNAYKAFQTAFGIGGSGGGEVEPDEPDVPVEPDEPEVTLTSISAVYSGGDVTAGTAVNDLTGIVVTAHYSDGTSKAVTGYTLSGTIAEGSNTITVSYGGKTTMFTVTGVTDEPDEPIDTSVKIAKAGYAFNSSATEEVERAALSISEYYDVPDGYTGKLTYFFPDNSTSGIGQYLKMQMCNDANEKVEYWSLSVGTAEKTVNFYHAQATKFRFSIETASVDNAYMYYTGTGDIVFAGKNTKYYGMRNISQYTGA